MKPQELRIGCFINHEYYDGAKHHIYQGVVRTINNGSCNVTNIGDSSPIVTVKFGNLIPIPLTEEWLLKLGFKYSEERASMSNGFEEWEQDSIYLGPLNNECYIIDALDQGGIHISIYHIHQLQNLYFALTGEELIIKD